MALPFQPRMVTEKSGLLSKRDVLVLGTGFQHVRREGGAGIGRVASGIRRLLQVKLGIVGAKPGPFVLTS